MDYPVLVNPGKPSKASLHREGHEEENQGGRLRGCKTPQKSGCRAKSRAVPRQRAGIPLAGGLR
jgi:hypothetical protein